MSDRQVFECKDFDEWFIEAGYDDQHKHILSIAWDAALSQAARYVGQCEGTDFGLEHDLKS